MKYFMILYTTAFSVCSTISNLSNFRANSIYHKVIQKMCAIVIRNRARNNHYDVIGFLDWHSFELQDPTKHFL